MWKKAWKIICFNPKKLAFLIIGLPLFTYASIEGVYPIFVGQLVVTNDDIKNSNASILFGNWVLSTHMKFAKQEVGDVVNMTFGNSGDGAMSISLTPESECLVAINAKYKDGTLGIVPKDHEKPICKGDGPSLIQYFPAAIVCKPNVFNVSQCFSVYADMSHHSVRIRRM